MLFLSSSATTQFGNGGGNCPSINGPEGKQNGVLRYHSFLCVCIVTSVEYYFFSKSLWNRVFRFFGSLRWDRIIHCLSFVYISYVLPRHSVLTLTATQTPLCLARLISHQLHSILSVRLPSAAAVVVVGTYSDRSYTTTAAVAARNGEPPVDHYYYYYVNPTIGECLAVLVDALSHHKIHFFSFSLSVCRAAVAAAAVPNNQFVAHIYKASAILFAGCLFVTIRLALARKPVGHGHDDGNQEM